MLRFLQAWALLAIPLLCLAADDSRPACGSHNQGRMWPEAANHDPTLLAHLVRCGELFICVRGDWHYHWEAPTVRIDQLGKRAKLIASKPSVCEEESVLNDTHSNQKAE